MRRERGWSFAFQSDTSYICRHSQDMAKEPQAKRIPHHMEIHGHVRTDDYHWMRLTDAQKTAKDPDQQTADVIAYLNEENAYTKAQLAPTDDLQKELFEEIVGRIKKDDESVPYRYNGFLYYTRVEKGKEYPIYCRKAGDGSDEQVMLDVNVLAKGQEYCHVTGLDPSPDNKVLAFGLDLVSRRQYELRFLDLETMEYYPEKIKNTSGSVAWAADNKTLFYTALDPSLRSYKIFRHVLGTDQSEDVEVYHEADETFATYAYTTKSHEFVMIGCYSTVSTEFRYVSTASPQGEFKVVIPRMRDHEYGVSHFGDRFYILTNKQAKNFKLVSAPVNDPSEANWTEVIPHREDVLLEDLELFRDHMAVEERENGLLRIRVMSHHHDEEHMIEFDDPTYYANIDYNPEFDTDKIRFSYASMRTPYSTFDHDMNTKENILLKQREVEGGHDPEQYVVKRMEFRAGDGELVPVSLVHRKDLEQPAPCLLYGYGSYGSVIDPGFSSVRLSLLDRGFVYAIAHVRGSEYKGRRWYEDGKLLKKRNTFEDFIACGEGLIENGLALSNKLFAMGGSAGGLLMGAVMNMRPDLFAGIVAEVPFVDVVSTMLDTDIPLTTGEFDEWGDPSKKEFYDYMLSYSPYDNVRETDYPHLLVTTGFHDSQVQYWEPAKWVAKLRRMRTNKAMLLLHCNMSTGHGGASGRFEVHKETAMVYAFLIHLNTSLT